MAMSNESMLFIEQIIRIIKVSFKKSVCTQGHADIKKEKKEKKKILNCIFYFFLYLIETNNIKTDINNTTIGLPVLFPTNLA